jgi:outer membrane protein OmpA-like peptidoglycan-associated protein
MAGLDLFSAFSIVTRAKHRARTDTVNAGGKKPRQIRTEMNMHDHRNTSRALGMLAASFLLMAGCGPIVFADDSALGIVGTAPPPPVEAPAPQKRVEVRDNKIVINEKVQFEYDSAKILEVSHSLLNEVADVIKKNPQIKKIEVQGHASAEGGDRHNLNLSDRRAKAVREFLVKKAGIAKDMLTSKGYGETQPIADNETEEGRVQNRRVEFVITEQDIKTEKVEIDDQGNEKVIEEGQPSG